MSSSQRSPSPAAQATPAETEPSTSTQPSSEIVSRQSPSAISNQEIDPEAKLRNAAAQARHRAKRKAYVSQLEQSVNTLKDTLKNATNHALLQQLEEENKRLAEELQLLQTQLGGSNSSDDGQDLSNTEQWAASASSLSQYLTAAGIPVPELRIEDMDEFDESVDSTQFGLRGWSPGPQPK